MFHDVRFPTRFQFGAKGGPTFQTVVNENSAGYEQRNGVWSQARRTYDYQNALESESQYAEVLAFFYGRMGKLFSFRVKDWFDYRITTAAAGIMVGVSSGLEEGDGAEAQFQIQKKYTYGPFTHTRTIVFPVDQSVYDEAADLLTTTSVMKDGVDFGVENTDWSIDYNSGIVTFAVAPAAGVVVAFNGHFDVPVRFANDDLPSTYAQWNDLQTALNLVEVRLEGEATP